MSTSRSVHEACAAGHYWVAGSLRSSIVALGKLGFSYVTTVYEYYPAEGRET